MKNFLTVIVLGMILLTACMNMGDRHLIQDREYRELVHMQFLKQRELAHGRDSVLFSVFKQPLTKSEAEGLEFLYAFMPLSDLAMNDGEYNLAQVRSALEAKEFFEWGKMIPEEIFLHFILPYRVNNEYTDTARQVFFAELKDRIKGMGMAEAALEVNHWCHEKVVYKSTDERTSGPLTTVRTAFGRCGEESTFAVAALRSVCIPARQVYTPRWAHTDDNHAWVEVWIDGKWHFMGACEPEPELNMAWFAEPVKRAMMTHTFVFGQYRGKEEILEKKELYTRLNLLNNYAETKVLPVKVTGPDGKPAENARVEYSLYNYAEFYPIATLTTGADGVCSATTGLGDLMMWASKDGMYGNRLVPGASSDTVEITLQRLRYDMKEEQFTLTPPVKRPIQAADPVKAEANNRRLRAEDSIRNVYIETFIDSVTVVEVANRKGLDADELWYYVSHSRGNWKEILAFAEGLNQPDLYNGMALLAGISEKDLHDAEAETLNDHLRAFAVFRPVPAGISEDLSSRYVLAPRIGREYVTRWRSFIQRSFSSGEAAAFRTRPMEIRSWINNHIALDTLSNYYGVPLSPEGMLELGRADRYSRDLLFVAIARSFGIPSRLEPATRRPQYLSNDQWMDVFFNHHAEKLIPRGEVVLENGSEDKTFLPRYYSHFTVSRFEQGRFITLDYEFDESLNTFPCRLTVDTGYYRLVTGNRLNDGSVMCNISYFRVKDSEPVRVVINLASRSKPAGRYGKLDSQAAFSRFPDKSLITLDDLGNDRGMIIALIDPGKEPTKHLLEDLKKVKEPIGNWGGPLLLLVAKEKLGPGFSAASYTGLPANAVFGHDLTGGVAAAAVKSCNLSIAPQWPVVIVINNNGEVSWYSEGYSIGLGDQLLKQILESGK